MNCNKQQKRSYNLFEKGHKISNYGQNSQIWHSFHYFTHSVLPNLKTIFHHLELSD